MNGSANTCGDCVRIGDASSMACDCFYKRPGNAACDQFEPKRRALALELWKATGSQSNERLSDSLLGDILEIAIADFVTTYNCMRGHRIDPVYATALRHDMLIAIEAAAKAPPLQAAITSPRDGEGRGTTQSAPDDRTQVIDLVQAPGR